MIGEVVSMKTARNCSFKCFAVILITLMVSSMTIKLLTSGHVKSLAFSYQPQVQSTNFLAPTRETLLNDIQTLTSKMEKCFEVTNLGLFDGLSTQKAKMKAQFYARELRKVIPENFQQNYAYPNHCWKTDFNISTEGRHIWGHVGNVTFDEVVADDYRSFILHDVEVKFHNHFYSRTVCLPNLFLLGFPKCGSTFLWCLIETVVNVTTGVKVASQKEPFWWDDEGRYGLMKFNASDFGRYFVNYVSPISAVDTSSGVNIVLADGSPGMAYAVPRFIHDQKDHPKINYCLLPSVIPHFLPHAKYIMVMRDPVDALYSMFWLACGDLPAKRRSSIPDTFHKKVVQEVDNFNGCMRNKKVRSVRHICSLSASDYSSCITHPKRLLLLDMCVVKMNKNRFSQERIMTSCGRVEFYMYMYYIHVRRWLSVASKDQFYFLTLNDSKTDPITVAKNVLKLMRIPLSSNLDEKAFSGCEPQKNIQRIKYRKNPSLQMRTDTRSILRKFFAPFNKMLSELLGDSKFLFNS